MPSPHDTLSSYVVGIHFFVVVSFLHVCRDLFMILCVSIIEHIHAACPIYMY